MRSILTTHTIEILIGKFKSVFLGVYLLKITEGNITSVLLFYLCQYATTILSSYIVSKKVNGRNIISIYRKGIIGMAVVFLILALLREKLPKYMYIMAILLTFSGQLYWIPYKMILYTFKNEVLYKKLFSYNSIITNIVSILGTLGMGYIITKLSYIYIFITIFIIALIGYLVSFKIENVNYNQEKYSDKKAILVLKNKNAKLLNRMVFWEGIGYGGPLGFAIQLLIYIQTNSEFSLGYLNAIFSIAGMISAFLVNKLLKKKNYNQAYLISSILIMISTIPLVFRTSLNYFIVYNITFKIFYQITSILSNIAVSNLNKDRTLIDKKIEFTYIQQAYHAIGKVIGILIMIYITNISFSIRSMQIIVVIFSSTIVFQAFDFIKWNSTSSKLKEKNK